MAEFTDINGNRWTPIVTVTAAERLRREDGIDLFAALERGTLSEIGNDPLKLTTTVYRLCETQADRDNVTPEQFGAAMDGDALEQALYALRDALVNFCHRPEKKELLRRAIKAEDQAMARLLERSKGQLTEEQINAAADRAYDQALSAGRSTDAPA